MEMRNARAGGHTSSLVGSRGRSPSSAILVKKSLPSGETVSSAFEKGRSTSEDGLVPDVYTFNALIDGLCKSERIRDVMILHADMKRAGCSPDVTVYNTLFSHMNIDDIFVLQETSPSRWHCVLG